MKKKAGSPGAKISRNVRETIAADDETDLNLALESLVISQPQDRNGEKSSLLSRAHQFVVRVAEWDVICVTRIDIPKFRQLMPPRISERGREREREGGRALSHLGRGGGPDGNDEKLGPTLLLISNYVH